MFFDDPLAAAADGDGIHRPLSYQPRSTSRVGDACRVMILALVLLGGGLGVLLYQESHAVSVRRAFSVEAVSIKTIENGQGEEIVVVDPRNNRRLVHVTGTAKATRATTLSRNDSSTNTDATIVDDIFGIRANDNTLKLRRFAEMYQWVESEQVSSKTGVYTYSQEWASTFQDSDDFDQEEEHKNPDYMQYRSKAFEATNVQVGDFVLSENVMQKMNWYEAIQQTIGVQDIIDEAIQAKANVVNNVIYITNNNNDNHDPSQDPQIGDSRITYQVIPSQTVSIVAQQVDQTLVPYQKVPGGPVVLLVQPGAMSAADMMQQASTTATSHLGWYRWGCFLLLYMGLVVLAKPASILEDVFPLITTLTGPNFDLSVAAVRMLPIAAFVVVATVAICWLTYAPIICLLVLASQAYVVYYIGRRCSLWGIHPDVAPYLEEFMELRNVLG